MGEVSRCRLKDRIGCVSGSSRAFILGLSATTIVGNDPFWLPSRSIDPRISLAEGTSSNRYGLEVGLVWWTLGVMLAGAYFIDMFRYIRGKFRLGIDRHGH